MKKYLQTGIAVGLCFSLLLALPSCTMFRTMRENLKKAGEIVIRETPAEQELKNTYAAALDQSLQACEKVESSVSFRVSDVSVPEATGSRDPALLNAAAGQLAALLMQDSPADESQTLTPADAGKSLLPNLKEAPGATLRAERNMATEAETDEKGNEKTDENGDVITRTYIADNLLELYYECYTETVVEEAHTDEDGNEVEAVTERVPAAKADVEAVFGAPRDKAKILAEFDVVKDYLQVRDYTLEYTDSFAKCELDLDLNRLDSVSFEKHMTVTAQVEGVGKLADYGTFTVTFAVNETTAYSFVYPEAA